MTARSSLGFVAWICTATPAVALAWPAPMLDLGGATPATEEVAFPAPVELAPAIGFWTDVFTKHESHRVVIHDREHMEIVWKVLQLPRDEDGEVIEAEVRELIQKTLDDVRARLKRLERNPAPTDDDDRVLLAVAGEKNPELLEDAWTRVRAQRGVADKFRDGLERADTYLKDIRPILADEGVPGEIAALPFVESMFNTKARSSAGAAGLWQLMPATARGLGLVVKKGRDDRLDVKKSTRAAAKMLRQNHKMLGNWPLAITGYNHGPYGVKRAVKKVGSTDLVYLIEHYEKKTWGFASKNFYAEFIAAIRILEDHEERREALVTKEGPPAEEAPDKPL